MTTLVTSVATDPQREIHLLQRNAKILALHLCRSTHGVVEVYAVHGLPFNKDAERMISLLITVPEMVLQTYREILGMGVSKKTLPFYQVRRIAAGAALGSSFWAAVGTTIELTRRETLANELDLLLLPRDWRQPAMWQKLTGDLHLSDGYLEKAKQTARLLDKRRPQQEQWRV